MKPYLPYCLLPFLATSSFAGNFFGPGPNSQGWYYPGQMDGKYQASVTGVNIAGAVGFAFRDGAPTVSTNSTETTAATATSAGVGVSSSVQNNIIVDPTQNYFLIFVQGITYSGIATAAMNVDQSTVTGALFGGQNSFSYIALGTSSESSTTVSGAILDNLSMLNRGVNGGFTAKIDSKKAVFTFSGEGELSAPAFPQSVQGFDTDGNIVPPSEFLSNAVTAIVETATVPFDINGIKVSSSSASTIQTPTAGN